MQHSFLPPSGASAWSKCALWPTMNAKFPQDDSPATIEGTAAHWVAWEMLADRPVAEGQATPEGVTVTSEMLDGGELLVDAVHSRMNRMLDVAIDRFLGWHIEERTDIHSIDADCFGTPDLWAFDLSSAHLEIIDYKFGHRFVDEFFNPQGLLYLAGILAKLKLIGDPQYVTVAFTIVQPRCYHQARPVRTHRFTVRDAAAALHELQLAAKAARALEPIATTNRACGDCPGRHACDALQEAAYSAAEYSNNRQPHNLTPAAAALELRMLDRAKEILDARVDGLRELTLANLKAGARVPYFSLAEGRGRQQWNVPIEQVIAIGQMFEKDLAKPGTVTPAQARKLGLDENIVSAYSTTPAGSLKLLAENPSDARKVFGNSGE